MTDTKAWAAKSPSGHLIAFSVRPTRAEVINYMPQFSVGATDYETLTAEQCYAKARRNGWRVVKVIVTEQSS